jgi:hypothetical protein
MAMGWCRLRASAQRRIFLLMAVTGMACCACSVGAVDAPQAGASAESAATTELAGSTVIARSDLNATLSVGQSVSIDNPYGDVHVRFGGFEHRIETHAVMQEPQDAAAHIALTPNSSDSKAHYDLLARLPAGETLREGQRLDLSVLLPEGHALRVRTEHGTIDVHGVHGDVDVVSVDGNIELRGIKGAVQAQTGSGSIEASLARAPRGSAQRLATTTGDIRVGVDDGLDAQLEMSTANQFATDYSLVITRHPGEERNKLARAVIGKKHARLKLESARGEIRLLRRTHFTAKGKAPSGEDAEEEDNDSD